MPGYSTEDYARTCSHLGEPVLDFSEVGLPTMGRRISAVGNCVDHDIVDARFLRRPGESHEVILVTVNPTVRHETQQVEATSGGLGEDLRQRTA